MTRAPVECISFKRGTWTPEEDRKLVSYIERYRIWNWNHMARFAGLSRSGKSCRLRWMNYLRPSIRRGNFSQAEEELIIKMQQQLGNRWSMIASKLPGRTDNEIKNYWNTRFKNNMKRKSWSSKLGSKTFKSLPENDDCALLVTAKPSSSDLDAVTPMSMPSSPQISISSYSLSNIDSQLSEFDSVSVGNNKMETLEWFIELGSLWEEPLMKIEGKGLCKVENSEATITEDQLLYSSALFDSVWQF